MNKAQFSNYFRTEIEPTISKSDKPALRQAWNDELDRLRRDNVISDKTDWTHPVRFYHPTEKKRRLKPGTARIRKGDSITVIGKRWFDRGPGNTYHSVQVLVNGEIVHENHFEYGYDDAYITTAMRWLAKNYSFPRGFDSERSPLWQLRDRGIMIVTSVADVTKRKDL
jgi:hypothetical protein